MAAILDFPNFLTDARYRCFDFIFVIYAPELVELQYFLPLFYYLPKLKILQVCSFDGLLVCLSVLLSVSLSVLFTITHERFDISTPNLVHICI